ncbi:hypothetical protein HN789_03900 [archaeon]|jgi:hypothetical protein|nr:hypothetical protein [archaeon]MBT4023106.1 hypothetical protein [archaeon]MBT4272504.1 hypothetical protein [archaeon]MBT4460602.1 hypothetical protein [archaeon]MBT4857808.1 hypothetical protein [archaeon]
MIDKNRVLEIVRLKGPVIPREVVKEVGGDTFIIGAILSQLVDDKQIKISHAKLGGSPFYYYPGQESKLTRLYDCLHEKEKRAHDILKQRKVIRDSDADPLLKVVLRQIKDFAKALEVNIGNQKEIFWKWYLLPNSDAEPIIRQSLSLKPVPKEQEKREEELKEKEETQEKIIKKEEKIDEKNESVQEKLVNESRIEKTDDKLLNKINELFLKNNIKIIEKEIIRKNSDIELKIIISSCVGELKYFCKVKDKKKTNDKDLSSFYVDGQMKKLPILYITTGELTKKAKEKLEKEFTTISVLII